MDSFTGVGFNDLMGEYEFNLSDPVSFSTILVDNISENTVGNTVIFDSTITSKNILPDGDDTRDIGSTSKKFANAYIDNIVSGSSTFDELIVNSNIKMKPVISSFFSNIVYAVPVGHNNSYRIPDLNITTDFAFTGGNQTFDSKTFTNMVNVEIAQRASWGTVPSTTVAINKLTSDGHCYFDQGTTSTSGYVFRNNNGGSTLLNVLNTQITSPNQLSLSNATDTSISGASTASMFTSGGQTVTKSLYVGSTLFVANIQARSGQHLTIQPNGNCNIIPSAKLDLRCRNSDTMSFYGTTSNANMTYNFGKLASVNDFSIGICQNANDFVTGSILRDIVIRPAISTQTIWTGVSTTPYVSSNSTSTKIFPTTQSTSTTTGSLITNGGIGVAKDINLGGSLFLTTANSSPSTSTNNVIYNKSGNFGINLYSSQTGGINLNVYNGAAEETVAWARYNSVSLGTGFAIESTIDSSGISGFAGFMCSGGGYFAKKLYVGTDLYLQTTGGTASPLSYYEQANYNSTLAGALGTAAPTCIGNITRTGNVVTYNFQATSGISSSAAPIAWITSLPTRFRPSVQRDFVIGTINGATLDTGLIRISAAGAITAYATVATGNFTNGVTVGIYGTCISWTI